MTLQEELRQMIEDALRNSEWTSASPSFTNRVKKVNFTRDVDISAGLNESLPDTAMGRESVDTNETVVRYKDSGVEDVSRYGNSQISNLNSFVSNPFQFIIGAFGRALVRGYGPVVFFIALGKLIETIFKELLQPGRAFDVRFREMAQEEILKFTNAREQAEIRAGFRQIIVTTIGGLRGDAARGQIGGNFYTPDRVPADRIDPHSVTRIEPADPNSQGANIPLSKKIGGGAGVARARQ